MQAFYSDFFELFLEAFILASFSDFGGCLHGFVAGAGCWIYAKGGWAG